MKQCPQCRTTYSDDSLIYCLADGAVLAVKDDQATIVRTAGVNAPMMGQVSHLRVEIPQDAPTANYVQGPPPRAATGGSGLKIVLIVGIVGVMLVVAVIGAGALIYFNKDARPVVTNTNKDTNKSNASPSPSIFPDTTPTPSNSETDKLRDQIANLEKRLNEQKNANRPATNVPPPPDQPVTTPGTARVNSPGDGFLAMRSLPSSDLGERVVRIPHGANVSLGGCLARTRVGNKTGRWCRASYSGYTGWVFDAWLNY